MKSVTVKINLAKKLDEIAGELYQPRQCMSFKSSLIILNM